MPETELPLVLHVDDKETNRYIVDRILSKHQFRVISAASGKEGLEALQQALPDLIILDVRLPDINGIDLCKLIKQDEKLAGIPVLQMSAHYTGTAARTEILDSGADAYLASSAEPAELMATVRALLRVRRAEEAARSLAREWQATVDSVRDAIFIVNPEREVIRCNRAARALLNGEEPDGQAVNVGQLVPEFPSTNTLLQIEEDQGGLEPIEFQRNGRWYRLSIDSIEDVQSQGAAWVCVATDVTRERQVEQEIRRINDELISARDQAVQANRAKSAFLANMSHELRTPLNIMIGYSEMLHEDASHHGHEQYLADLVSIQKAGRHLVELVTEILDLSKIEAGRMDLHLDRLDVEAMLAELAETVKPLVEQRRNSLSLQSEGVIGMMWTDAAKLRQILLNLLSNACKFTSSGQIELKVERQVRDLRDWVIFQVRDTGAGISEDHLSKLFEEYSQFPSSKELGSQGTGLGLAISRRFTEMLGGRIDVESRVGEGSRFTVSVPATVKS